MIEENNPAVMLLQMLAIWEKVTNMDIMQTSIKTEICTLLSWGSNPSKYWVCSSAFQFLNDLSQTRGELEVSQSTFTLQTACHRGAGISCRPEKREELNDACALPGSEMLATAELKANLNSFFYAAQDGAFPPSLSGTYGVIRNSAWRCMLALFNIHRIWSFSL